METLNYFGEIWKDIKGYAGWYQVSNMGRVRSVDRYVNYKRTGLSFLKGHILKPKTDKDGYLVVNLSVNSKIKTHKIHRLVAEAFLPNPDNLPQVNHKDENKTNNCVDNLEWCSSSYNNAYGTRTERQATSYKNGRHNRYYKDNPNSKMVMEYDKDGKEVMLWFSLKAAAEHHNKNSATIWQNISGKSKTMRDGTYFRYYKGQFK